MIQVSMGIASLRVTTNTGRRLSSASAHQISPWVGVTATKIPRQSFAPMTYRPTQSRRRFEAALDIHVRSAPRSLRAGSGRQAVRGQRAPLRNDLQQHQPPRADRPRLQGRLLLGSQVEPCGEHTKLQCVSQCTPVAHLAIGTTSLLGWYQRHRINVGPLRAQWKLAVRGVPREPGHLTVGPLRLHLRRESDHDPELDTKLR